MRFGIGIRKARAARGMTQARLATLSGLDASYVSLLESGARAPSAATLELISSALNVPMYLIVLLGSEQDELRGIDASQAAALGEQLLRVMMEAE